MKNNQYQLKNYIELLIIGLVILLHFVLPALFNRINGEISWRHVFKAWEDQLLIIPIFAINHWLLVPRLLLKRRYLGYFGPLIMLIAVCAVIYYYRDLSLSNLGRVISNRPTPIPPYMNFLMSALLIVGVDSGLLFSRKLHENEEKQHCLEKENVDMQLDILRNQISPHFLMNTLNNIYALIDCNTPVAKNAVMRLSKLMRYMLYENGSGRVKLSKEFEFINSYVELMKLRFADEMTLNVSFPEIYHDAEIPPMIFISYIENAFKYGASYQNNCIIDIRFEVLEEKLRFTCTNSYHPERNKLREGGLGMKNNENRLRLLFGDAFHLSTTADEQFFNVSLIISTS